MQNILTADFCLFGFILIGLLVSSYSFISAEKPVPDSIKFWSASVVFAIIQYLISAIGVQISDAGFNKESPIFVFSNIAYLTSVIFQTLFCLALASGVSTKKLIISLGFLIAFSIQSIFFIEFGLGYIAGLEIALIVPILQILQVVYLHKSCQDRKSPQLNLIAVLTCIQLIFTITRLVVVTYKILVNGDVESTLEYQEIPIALIVISTANMFFNVLSYQTMVGYWSARAVIEKVRAKDETIEINRLLIERNRLINSLSRVNKVSIAGALSASMAHELNQPLGSIKLSIQVLRNLLEQSDIPPVAKQVMQEIESENNRATSLITTLRLIFIEKKIEKNYFLLDDLVRSVGDLYKGRLQEAQISLNYSLNSVNPILGNSLEFHQLIANLILNSIEALVQNKTIDPKIVITSYQNDAYIFLSVADNGPGVEGDRLAEIYDLIKPSSKMGGMGFGLWLVKFIVERHGGEISHEPVISGGAKFTIKIPYDQIK